MKYFKKSVEKKFRLSLSIKWAIGIGLFIFILFTIFALVTFQICSYLLVDQEKENLIRTTSEITNRLSDSNSELNVISTVYNLKETSERYTEKPYKNKNTSDYGMIRLDSFISELSQPKLTVTIYNTEEELIFESKDSQMPLFKSIIGSTSFETIDGNIGILLVKKVYSKESNELIGYVQTFFELSAYFSLRQKMLVTLACLEIVSVIISIFLSLFLTSYFLKPLKKMGETINLLREEPQMDIRMPKVKTNDELSDLTEIFNDMLDRMHQYIGQQEQFVEDVSHELRTPVAIIEGHLNMLNRWGKEDPEILDESLKASLQEISRMKTLVQEMLDLSRVEQVPQDFLDKECSAKEVIHQTINNLSLLYPEFSFHLKDALMYDFKVKIYRNHFEQLLIILLDNAVKYSTMKPEISIFSSVNEEAGQLEISISDYGEGIPKEDLEKIFNRFYRVDKARSREKGGNGLGLAIAQQLIENYGGLIKVSSKINEGTTFIISLPIRQ